MPMIPRVETRHLAPNAQKKAKKKSTAVTSRGRNGGGTNMVGPSKARRTGTSSTAKPKAKRAKVTKPKAKANTKVTRTGGVGRRIGGKKNKAATPIGRGKKKSLKRAVHDSGGGRKALKTARSLSKGVRKQMAARGGTSSLTRTLKGVRDVRRSRGQGPQTGITRPKNRK